MNFPNLFQNSLSFLDNKYVSASVSLFLVLYAGMAAPELPEGVARLFEHKLFRIFVFFLIAYTGNKDPTVAIIAAVGLMVSLQTLNRYNVEKHLVNLLRVSNIENEEVQDSTNEVPSNISSDEDSENDFKNNFYPSYVNSDNQHMVREYDDDITAFSGKKYASV